MKKLLPLFILGLLLALPAGAEPLRRDNYVVFNVKGDCKLEDCIGLARDMLQPLSASIVAIDATSLAPHQTTDYKTVNVTFKDLNAAPYQQVMQQLAAMGYDAVSYVIHDTHTGQDVIIPH